MLKEKEIKERIAELDRQIENLQQQANMQLSKLTGQREELDRILNPEKYEQKQKQRKQLDVAAKRGLNEEDDEKEE